MTWIYWTSRYSKQQSAAHWVKDSPALQQKTRCGRKVPARAAEANPSSTRCYVCEISLRES